MLPSTTAMRSSGTPSRIASTMPRTIDPHFVVGVGGRPHRGAVRGSDRGAGRIELAAEPLDARDHLGVGLGDAGEPGDDDQLVASGQRAQQARDRTGDALREMAHERAELGDERDGLRRRARARRA